MRIVPCNPNAAQKVEKDILFLTKRGRKKGGPKMGIARKRRGSKSGITPFNPDVTKKVEGKKSFFHKSRWEKGGDQKRGSQKKGGDQKG